MMRLNCFHCGKNVSTEIPDETIFRAVSVCPECISSGLDIYAAREQAISETMDKVSDALIELADSNSQFATQDITEVIGFLREHVSKEQ